MGQFFETLEPQRVVQLVEVPKIVVGLAVSSSEVGSSGPEERHMTRHVDATVAEAVGEARPPGIAEHNVSTAVVPRERVQQRTAEKLEDASQSLEKTVEAVTLFPRERVQQRTAARPGTAKKSVTTKSDIAVSLGEAGLGPRLPEIAKPSATTKPELAESPGEALLGPGLVARPTQPLLQRSPTLMMKLDLQGLQSTAPRQLLHSLRNMGLECAMRSLEKLCERHDLPAWLV